MEQPKVFVSHSHVDDAFAERLVADLRAAGADAWLDNTDLGAGDFQARIDEALTNCDWFVLVLTHSALASSWVQQEVRAANRLKHQGRIRDLIFIQAGLVEHRELPPLWGVYNIFDATNDYNKALVKTLEAMDLLLTVKTLPSTLAAMQFVLSESIQFDASRNEIRVNGTTMHLTPAESRILQLLAINMGQVCTLGQIAQYSWGSIESADSYLIKAHIRHLREKIESSPSDPRYIVTVPGVGYVLRHPESLQNPDVRDIVKN